MEKLPLADDYAAFLRLLNEHDVEYLIIGGYAVGIHGYVRTTGDLDIWVRPTDSNANLVVAAIQDFGFDTPDLTIELFTDPKKVTRLGEKPVQIEIFTEIKGPDFDTCFDRRIVVQWGEDSVPVIGLDDLIAAKRASGRHIDLNDVEKLGAVD